MDITQLVTVAEYAGLILTVALGLAKIGLWVWAYIDHGHPDAKREWVQRAVQLAVLATDQAENLLGVGAGTPVDEKAVQDIAHRAEAYLADHGFNMHLDPETIRLVLNELRDFNSNKMGFQPSAKTPATPAA